MRKLAVVSQSASLPRRPYSPRSRMVIAPGHARGRPSGRKAQAAQIDAAIAAYQRAVTQNSNDLEARWKLLRALRFKGSYVAQNKDERRRSSTRLASSASSRWRSSNGVWPPRE